MTDLEDQLKRINDKLQQLLKKHQSLQKENDRLKQEFQQLSAKNQHQTTQIGQLIQQGEVLKLSKADMNDTEKKAFERRLNQYIKEIDRCITLLSE